MICRASWLMKRGESVADSQWQPCRNDATNMAHLSVSADVVFFIPLCDPHSELWADAIGQEQISLELS